MAREVTVLLEFVLWYRFYVVLRFADQIIPAVASISTHLYLFGTSETRANTVDLARPMMCGTQLLLRGGE
jgi:hypothetical protein